MLRRPPSMVGFDDLAHVLSVESSTNPRAPQRSRSSGRNRVGILKTHRQTCSKPQGHQVGAPWAESAQNRAQKAYPA